jgi:hypothetical protein
MAQQLTDRLNLPDDGRHCGLLIAVQRHSSAAYGAAIKPTTAARTLAR